MSSVLFDQLTRDELRERAPVSTLLIPLGSTEQHGPHLPVCTDVAIVSAIAVGAAESASERIPVLVGPTIPIGFAHHHLPFGATLSVTSPTFIDVLVGLAESAHACLFPRLVFLNGHGGNEGAMFAAIDRIVVERRIPISVAATSYWMAGAAAIAEFAEGLGPSPGHAGDFETSVMLALAPDSVRLADRRPRPHDTAPGPDALERQRSSRARIRIPDAWTDCDGRSDDAARADALRGRVVFDRVVAAVAEFICSFHLSTGGGNGVDVDGSGDE
jgi:creatinine amidohydrolase